MDDTVKQSDDTLLLRRFLAGELAEDALVALEDRLDREPELQRRLGELAREPAPALDDPLPFSGTVRIPTAFTPPPSSVGRDRNLEIGEVIGEGGMGVVHVGQQHSVGRQVAIKTIKSPQIPTGPLLEEAFITGQLEHPNIVPIHDISVDDEGRPLVVLKRIEGMPWSKLVSEPHLIAERYGVWNALDWHIGILVQVCQALRFAHSRGIIHRDVKPANVMIGAFDEVYLLDWGLAISTSDDDPRVPTITTSHGIAGTPAYMAPEQFDEDPAGVGPHTDIYLVGATLYEAAVGKPPQRGDTMREIKDEIAARDGIAMPEGTPAEIVTIVNRAMAVEPGDRYADIQELRNDLEDFVTHRGSQDLVELADERVAIMDAAHERKDEEAAERAFVEAAFGYRTALDTWSGNHQARTKLGELVDRRVGQLLSLKAPRAARRALALIDAPDPDLIDRVDAEIAHEEADRARFDKFIRDDDRRVGLGVRRVLVLLLGTAWIEWWSVVGWSPPDDLAPLLVGTLVYWLLAVGLVLRVRREMLEVRLNRFIAWIVFSILTAQLLWLGTGMLQGRSVTETLTTMMLMWALGLACAGVTVDLRILPTAIGYTLGFFVCTFDPSHLRWVLAAGAVLIVVNTLVVNYVIARQVAREDAERSPS